MSLAKLSSNISISSSSLLGDENGAPTGSDQLVNSEAVPDSALTSFQNRIFSRKASKRSLMIAFRQLSLMVETGIDVAEALELVASSCRQEGLRNAFDEIYEKINQGVSFSSAVKDQEEVLGEEIAASIQAGEASGKMVEVLRQISDRLETELNVQAEVRGAMAYPLVLLTASVLVAATLVWFVLPQFEQSFLSMGVDPPALTSLLMNGSTLIREHVLWFGVGLVGLAIGAAMILTNRTVQLAINQAIFVSPIVGTPIRLLEVGRLFTSLGHLLSNGVSILESIQLLRKSTRISSIQNLTLAWEDDIVQGKGLSNQLDDFTFLPDGAAAMLIMAERTGKLEVVLETAGRYYQEEGRKKLTTLLKMSEPIIIVVLGVFVGTVVASVLLPILDVQSSATI